MKTTTPVRAYIPALWLALCAILALAVAYYGQRQEIERNRREIEGLAIRAANLARENDALRRQRQRSPIMSVNDLPGHNEGVPARVKGQRPHTISVNDLAPD